MGDSNGTFAGGMVGIVADESGQTCPGEPAMLGVLIVGLAALVVLTLLNWTMKHREDAFWLIKRRASSGATAIATSNIILVLPVEACWIAYSGVLPNPTPVVAPAWFSHASGFVASPTADRPRCTRRPAGRRHPSPSR